MSFSLKQLKGNFLKNSDEIFTAFAYLKNLKIESFYLVLLENNFTIITVKKIRSMENSKNRVIVKPKKILEECFLTKSNNIIIVHNHPSGSSFPSERDIYSTQLLKSKLFFFEIHLIDHIIIGNDNFSFKKANLL